MSLSVRTSIIVGSVALLTVFGMSVPANAVPVSLPTQNGACTVDGAATSNGATVTNQTCTTARARVDYLDSVGAAQTKWGVYVMPSSASVATASTLSITGRAAQGTKSGAASGSVFY